MVCCAHFNMEMSFAPLVCNFWTSALQEPLFDIGTSKSGPTKVCFVHVDLKMCFAPQRRAIFHFSSGQWLRTRRFTSLLFDPPDPNHSKNRMFRDFQNKSTHLYLLSSNSFSFSLLLFSSLLFISPYCRQFDF